ncbi:MAG: class I SAM-dependent methyltransferase [Deltaproteobacteria bacterium]|nr:class I SAM-dependent methyltransferase [Deltaproteobacteria bacterium]
MTLTALSRGAHLEPPPWLYARLARGSLMRLIYRRLIQDLAGSLPPGTRLLDVGTGPGYLLGYLARARPDLSLWGLDFSPDMIRRAQPRQRAMAPRAAPRWLVADACRLPFPAGVFGHVVASFSFHIWPCPVAGLTELQRVLAPGGRAWVYELRREATVRDLRAFARETRLPLFLVRLGYKIVSRHHALPESEFAHLLRQAAGPRGTLQPAHHIFWRAELRQA